MARTNFAICSQHRQLSLPELQSFGFKVGGSTVFSVVGTADCEACKTIGPPGKVTLAVKEIPNYELKIEMVLVDSAGKRVRRYSKSFRAKQSSADKTFDDIADALTQAGASATIDDGPDTKVKRGKRS